MTFKSFKVLENRIFTLQNKFFEPKQCKEKFGKTEEGVLSIG